MLSLLLSGSTIQPVFATAVNEIQVGYKIEQLDQDPVILELEQDLSNTQRSLSQALNNKSSSISSRSSAVVPLPLLAEEPDPLYEHKLLEMGFSKDEDFPYGVYPFNFGQFLIGQLTLVEYNNIWKTVRDDTMQSHRCRLHYSGKSFIASGMQCISYFNYIEAHADKKGMLSSISIAGNQPEQHSTAEMLEFLAKRYRPLSLERMPEQLRELAELRLDLCNDLTKLMEGKYKCEEHWFYFRNFYMVFSPSVYQDHRKEQFIYGTLHHFVDYETKMVKRRLAIVRQELNAKHTSKD